MYYFDTLTTEVQIWHSPPPPQRKYELKDGRINGHKSIWRPTKVGDSCFG